MLTTAQVEHYHTEGYVAVPGFLSAEDVAAFLREMDAVSVGNTLANHDVTRMEMEPNQPPDGTQVRRLYEPCSQTGWRTRSSGNSPHRSAVSSTRSKPCSARTWSSTTARST